MALLLFGGIIVFFLLLGGSRRGQGPICSTGIREDAPSAARRSTTMTSRT